MCAANINDKWRKYKSRFSTTLSTTIGTGVSDTLTPATVTGLPTDTAITLMIDRVDSTGARTPTKLELIKGIVSGGNLTSYVRAVEGTEQQHTGGAVIEMVWNAADWNDAVDSFLAGHTQAGAHVSALPLTSPVLTTPKVVTSINDANGNEVIKTPATTSAVNEVTVTNSATGNAVQISATGDDTNIDLKLVPKGTGAILDKNGDALAPNDGIYINLLNNSLIEVAQRGTSFTGNSIYTVDRWKHYDTGASRTITQDTDVPSVLSKFSLKGVIVTGGANKETYDFQRVEGINAAKYSGKKITYDFWIKASVAAGTINLAQVYFEYCSALDNWNTFENATGTSYAFTATSSWTRITGSLTLPATSASGYSIANGLSFNVNLRASDNTTLTYRITQARVYAGDVALPFQPKSFEEELRACMRYYEKSYPYSVVPGTATIAGQNYAKSFYDAGAIAPYDGGRYRVEKRAIPTLVIYNPSAGTANQVRNEADGSTVGSPWTTPNNNTSSMGLIVKAASFSTTGTYAFQFTADAEL